jgi:shikimate dehydrogenase
MLQLGLIGKTLSHSWSKQYFTDFFSTHQIDAVYNLFELPTIEAVEQFLAEKKVKGCNVTIPYKKLILPFLDILSAEAKQAGAVNTIVVKDNQWHGHNTDIGGFEFSLKKNIQAHHQKAMILGNGGAAQAVKIVLKKLQIPFIVVERMPGIGNISYAALDEKIIQTYSLIINTTPLGMYPAIETQPPIPYSFITEKHLLFDLVYNPIETKFLKKGKEQGAAIVNGLEMLQKQAELAWEIFVS